MTNHDAPKLSDEMNDAVALAFEMLRRFAMKSLAEGEMNDAQACMRILADFEESWNSNSIVTAASGRAIVWDEETKELVAASARGGRLWILTPVIERC